jgi:isoleucyl-tRNA synthetase
MAPIMSFTAQELWEELSWHKEEFVFTQVWYETLNNLHVNAAFDNDFWLQVLEVKEQVNRGIESARKAGVIKGSLQAEVNIYATHDLAVLLNRLEDELRFVLITSAAKVLEVEQAPTQGSVTEIAGLWLEISASSGQKCARCWHHRPDVGSNAAHPEICLRCVENVDGEGEKRAYA